MPHERADPGWRAGQIDLESDRSARSIAKAVNLGGQDEIAFGEPVNGVSPDRDVDPSPCQEHVRMVSLVFGDLAYLIDEAQCLFEVGKLKHTLNMMFVDHAPGGHLLVERL